MRKDTNPGSTNPKTNNVWLLIMVVVAIGIAFFSFSTSHYSALAQQVLSANVRGVVTDKQTGLPVPQALVLADDLALSTYTDAAGRFSWHDIHIAQTGQPTTITINAEGYPQWTIQDVRLYANDTLILNAQLDHTPSLIIVPPPHTGKADAPEIMGSLSLDSVEDHQLDLPLPATIRVRITGYPYCDLDRPYEVEVIDFMDYVKHVLPNEWPASWHTDSLRAGAMAAKMYAWSIIAKGGKWPDADVYDSTCDQVYNPAVEYESTNLAVDYTWDWRLTKNDRLFRTYYRHLLSQCIGAGLAGICMGQVESNEMANDGYAWEEILFNFYDLSELSYMGFMPGGYSLHFYGNTINDIDRLNIQIDDPSDEDPGPPVDIGGEDFTVEWWMKANPGENNAGSCTPGGENWVYGNNIFDRSVYDDLNTGEYGISLGDGRIAFGINTGPASYTLCGSINVTDEIWHHIAVTRSLDGVMRIFIDGVMDAETNGPIGDISYPDDREQTHSNDPFLVIGAKNYNQYINERPAFIGWVDEIRISNILRYVNNFTPPIEPFTTDVNTLALYHFDEGIGGTVIDSSGHPDGPSNGSRAFGGSPPGPRYSTDTIWYEPPPTPTPTPTELPTSTSTSTSTDTSTSTPTPTSTSTSTPTATSTATPTNTSTITSTPTITPTSTSTSTSTSTPTSTPTSIFGDVPFGHWAFDYINALYEDGYVAGCSAEPRLYCPERILNRAESSVFVLRGEYGTISDPPYPPPDTPTFVDVAKSYWGYGWIESLWTDGFTAGCNVDPPMYCPLQQHTRAEGSVFFLRVKNGVGYTPPTPTGIFGDVDLEAWYAGWVEAAFNQGILPACQDDPPLFCPEDELDRAWAAYMMVQAKGGLPLP